MVEKIEDATAETTFNISGPTAKRRRPRVEQDVYTELIMDLGIHSCSIFPGLNSFGAGDVSHNISSSSNGCISRSVNLMSLAL